MSDKKKLTAEDLAAALEEQARLIREKGLSDEDIDKIAGGGREAIIECCGSNCDRFSFACSERNSSAACANACIASSPN
jgi:hypothetical protein